MTTLVVAVLLTVAVLVFTLFVRAKDLPAPEPVSPLKHLEDRKARIYEGLRDLNFEYRVGKLSDQDYQRTKADLQRDLAAVLGEMEQVSKTAEAAPAERPAKQKVKSAATTHVCPRCNARFERAMKFCGECGAAMEPAQ